MNNKTVKKGLLPYVFLLSFIIVCLLIFLFVKFVIPNLFESIELMLSNIPIYINNIYDWLMSIF